MEMWLLVVLSERGWLLALSVAVLPVRQVAWLKVWLLMMFSERGWLLALSEQD